MSIKASDATYVLRSAKKKRLENIKNLFHKIEDDIIKASMKGISKLRISKKDLEDKQIESRDIPVIVEKLKRDEFDVVHYIDDSIQIAWPEPELSEKI